jgi:pSer/pThr/pTyr-binding forkhead associated (FHA) protein
MSSAWKLIIEDDAGKQIVVPFVRDVITIGRKEGNTIRLTERNVSRFHARLARETTQVSVEDLGSYNGIKLNGDRISGKVMVNEGDTIQIGDYHLALHAQDGAAAGKAQNGAGAGHKSNAVNAAQPPSADDDEFAGDTQRWEPPAGMAPLSVGMPTQEEPAVRGGPISEETSPAPIATITQEERGGGFRGNNNETERLVLGGDGGMAPQPTLKLETTQPSRPQPQPPQGGFSGNLEPTVKQAVASPAPISGVGKSLGGGSQGSGASLAAGMPAPDSLLAETRPEKVAPPTSPAAIPRSPGTTSGSKLPAVTDPLGESTEAMRPAPSANEDLTVPRLVVVNTIFCGSAFRISAAEAVVGRTEDNDITIEHRSVSRNHAKVVREGDRVRILDLKSANGVLVNGDEVEAAVLKSGDIVELGRVRMRFVPIGERFSVSADEIERARIADAQGDDFENESGTGITNPVRSRQSLSGTTGAIETVRPNLVMYGLIGVTVLVVVIALVILFAKGGNKEDEAPKPDTVAAVPDLPPVEPLPDNGKPPVEPKPDDTKAIPDPRANPTDPPPSDVANPPLPDAAVGNSPDDKPDDKPDGAGDDARRARQRREREQREREQRERDRARKFEDAIEASQNALVSAQPESAVKKAQDAISLASGDKEQGKANLQLKVACAQAKQKNGGKYKGCP